MRTHEAYIADVAALAIARLQEDDRKAFDGIKLTYGAGESGLRGVTYYRRWKTGHDCPNEDAKPFVEVCAFGQESALQIAGTVIHELAHVLAGWNAGHGPEWSKACKRLGLRRCLAAGTQYRLASFDPAIRFALAGLESPTDGQPVSSLVGLPGNSNGAPKPCTAGIGTKGGKSRGKGSGSRLRLFQCQCEPPIKVRASRDDLPVTCDCCTSRFIRV